MASGLTAVGAIAVERSRSRSDDRIRQFDRVLAAYADALSLARSWIILVSEAHANLESKSPFAPRLQAARSLASTTDAANTAVVRAMLVSDGAGREHLYRLQVAILEASRDILNGDGTTFDTVLEAVRDFQSYAQTHIDSMSPR